MTAPRIRTIAFYLPQFHPIPENDAWWGPGFTEWTNVAKARPLFRGHYQPHLPADLGFYDLRLPETRERQAALARGAGIEGFCYWHYWFGHGRRLLERPFEEVLQSGSPDFPFCLGWANETWTGIWHGAPGRVLVEQTYPGAADDEAHFRSVSRAFRDPRYVRVDGKPLFYVYRPMSLPDPGAFAARWRTMAQREGLGGLYLVGESHGPDWRPSQYGFDATVRSYQSRIASGVGAGTPRRQWRRLKRARGVAWVWQRVLQRAVHVYSYAEASRLFVDHDDTSPEYIPCVIPNWDNTPRSGVRGVVLHGSTPELFRHHLRSAVANLRRRESGPRLLFVKSWNEWAEGNHLEPDERFGHAYLDVLREELSAGARSHAP